MVCTRITLGSSSTPVWFLLAVHLIKAFGYAVVRKNLWSRMVEILQLPKEMVRPLPSMGSVHLFITDNKLEEKTDANSVPALDTPKSGPSGELVAQVRVFTSFKTTCKRQLSRSMAFWQRLRCQICVSSWWTTTRL